MEIVLGGYLETALIHYCDQIKQPDRNKTDHPYYMCLNRRVPKPFFDRAGTFVSLAKRSILPSIDWNRSRKGDPIDTDILGLDINGPDKFGGGEWDDYSRKLARHLIKIKAFSPKAWVHISDLDLKFRNVGHLNKHQITEMEDQIAEHYLCRIFLHVRASSEARALLVLSEPDLDLLAEIGTYAAEHKLALPFAFPNLRARAIDADGFAAGLLNYSPADALSLMAVKQDKVVKKYASKLSSVICDAESFDTQGKIIGAMRDAYEAKEVAHKAEKAFEIASWAVKPLHYVPLVAEVLAVAEDAKDLANLFLKRTEEAQDWHIVAAKMTDISVRDYLARKGNLG